MRARLRAHVTAGVLGGQKHWTVLELELLELQMRATQGRSSARAAHARALLATETPTAPRP